MFVTWSDLLDWINDWLPGLKWNEVLSLYVIITWKHGTCLICSGLWNTLISYLYKGIWLMAQLTILYQMQWLFNAERDHIWKVRRDGLFEGTFCIHLQRPRTKTTKQIVTWLRYKPVLPKYHSKFQGKIQFHIQIFLRTLLYQFSVILMCIQYWQRNTFLISPNVTHSNTCPCSGIHIHMLIYLISWDIYICQFILGFIKLFQFLGYAELNGRILVNDEAKRHGRMQ
jgi:hypothetical protein